MVEIPEASEMALLAFNGSNNDHILSELMIYIESAARVGNFHYYFAPYYYGLNWKRLKEIESVFLKKGYGWKMDYATNIRGLSGVYRIFKNKYIYKRVPDRITISWNKKTKHERQFH